MVGGDLSILKLSQKCFCYCTGTVQRTVALNRSIPLSINTIPKHKTTLMGGLLLVGAVEESIWKGVDSVEPESSDSPPDCRI